MFGMVQFRGAGPGVASMMSRSQKMQRISRKWKGIPKLGLVPMRSNDDFWMEEDSSLEHQVTITILSTASTETENSHFLVAQHGTQASDGSAASILSDLASEEQLHPRSSRSRRRRASDRRFKTAPSTGTSLPVPDENRSRRANLSQVGANKSIAPANVDSGPSGQTQEERIQTNMSTRAFQFVDSFNPLELNEEPLPDYAIIESFDSLSWGPVEDNAKGPPISSDSHSSWSSPSAKKLGRKKTEIDRNGFPKLDD